MVGMSEIPACCSGVPCGASADVTAGGNVTPGENSGSSAGAGSGGVQLSRSIAVTKASTKAGSNCLPAHLRSSATASGTGLAPR